MLADVPMVFILVGIAAYTVLSGADFFTVEVLTWRGLVTYYVLLYFIWRAGESPLPGSPHTPTTIGCNR